jgi:hypothetical protein
MTIQTSSVVVGCRSDGLALLDKKRAEKTEGVDDPHRKFARASPESTKGGFFRLGRWHEEDQGDTVEPLRPRAHAGGGQSMELHGGLRWRRGIGVELDDFRHPGTNGEGNEFQVR